MKPKIVVMPPPTKRRIRIRIGIAVYELSVNVAITPVALQAPAPLRRQTPLNTRPTTHSRINRHPSQPPFRDRHQAASAA
jgi:hypothetical protein